MRMLTNVLEHPSRKIKYSSMTLKNHVVNASEV